MPDVIKQVYFYSEGPCPLVSLCSQKWHSRSGSHECTEVLRCRYKCFVLSSSVTQKKPRKLKTTKIPKLEQEAEYMLILSPHWSRHLKICSSMTAETAQYQINCDNSVQPKAEVLTTSWSISRRHAVATRVSVHQAPTPVSRDTAHSHAVTAVGTQRKYYSSDTDFLPSSQQVCDSQTALTPSPGQQVSLSSQRWMHTQSCLHC